MGLWPSSCSSKVSQSHTSGRLNGMAYEPMTRGGSRLLRRARTRTMPIYGRNIAVAIQFTHIDSVGETQLRIWACDVRCDRACVE